jgi:hypothetical protein
LESRDHTRFAVESAPWVIKPKNKPTIMPPGLSKRKGLLWWWRALPASLG